MARLRDLWRLSLSAFPNAGNPTRLHQPETVSQAFGEALDPKRLEPLARYEAHLDRKLGRTLSMLIRLREMRTSASPD